MIILGIDPGRDGAAVLLDTSAPGLVVLGSLLWREVCPDGWAPTLVRDALLRLTRGYYPAEAGAIHVPRRIVLEAGQAARAPGGQGAGSYRIGVGWGVLWTVCALTWPGADLLTPAASRWTTILRDQPGEGKARAIALVTSRLPDLDLVPGRCRKPHDGLADAGALALWGAER